MKINVLISTINEGIGKVTDVILSQRDDVNYIISHQYTNEDYLYIPDELIRSDIYISHIEGAGVSTSRNNAITLADGDIGLFSDDDVRYRHNDFDTIKRTFLENRQVDIAIFKIRTPKGEPEYKKYPAEVVEYKRAPEVGTVQIAFNMERLKSQKVWFDERFGAGQPLLICNDERIFLHDCLKAGLRVFFIPEYAVQHPYESTIKSISKYDIRKNWTTGGVDCRINGPIALVKAFPGTVKIIPDLIKHKVNPFVYLYHRLSAVFFILRTRRKEKNRIKNLSITVSEELKWETSRKY